jgi:hypothetical protein
MTYLNEKHNEAVLVEESLSRVDSVLTDLSNTLFSKDPEHPLLTELATAIHAVADVNFDAPYSDAQITAGESWWDKAPV